MNWICKSTAGHAIHGQSVVYAEETGKDIAIVYDGAVNGGLIAAAPELLEALTMCRAWLEAHRPLEANRKSDAARDAVNAARAAVAKAEGGA